ncbi:HAD-IIB family hydrolase [Granulicella sp. L46]|uniref:HAD-IIB family hydrolase n=1 Tax=Granulicella sp. L46 TaxID=1641865 RepID=UPI00131DBD1D|nr:HAD family hydrolase [Granulicella sp. L46]
MPPRLIAIDLDGTLLNSSGQVSPRNLAALRLAESSGIEIVISTGRRHSFAMRVLRDLNLQHSSAVVSSNGTVIRTIGSELIHRTHLPLSTARWLCAHLNDYRSTLVLTFDLTGPDGEDSRGALIVEHLDDLHTSIGRWMRANEPYIQHVQHIEDALKSGANPPIQMMLCGPIDRMREAEALLDQHPFVTAVGEQEDTQAEVALHRTTYPETDLTLLDILPAGCSKASALGHLSNLRGLTPTDILAIGDNWNDVAMLRLAGQATLMSNAPDDLKALASTSGWTIVPSNDEDGVAVAIESVLSQVPV